MNAYINTDSTAMGTDWWVGRNLKIDSIGLTEQSLEKSLQTTLKICLITMKTAKYR